MATTREATVRSAVVPAALTGHLAPLMPHLGTLLPPDMSIETFRASLWVHLQTVKGLLACTPESLVTCTVRAATLGLLPERDVHFLPFNGVATCVPNYQGVIRMLERSGKVAKAFAQPVYEGDTFEVDYLADVFSHKPALHAKRTTILFYYGCVRMRDGTVHIDIMTLDEIAAIRRRSPAHDRGPWQTDGVMMARKTALKRVCKYVQLTPEAVTALADEEEIPPAGPTAAQQADTMQALGWERPGAVGEREALALSEVPMRATLLNCLVTLRRNPALQPIYAAKMAGYARDEASELSDAQLGELVQVLEEWQQAPEGAEPA